MERRYMTRCHLKGALHHSTLQMLTFPLFIREAHMLLDPSRHPLRVVMHNLLKSAQTFARQLVGIGRS